MSGSTYMLLTTFCFVSWLGVLLFQKLSNTFSLSSLGPLSEELLTTAKDIIQFCCDKWWEPVQLDGKMLQAVFFTLISPVLLILWISCLFNPSSLICACTIYAVPAEWDRTYSLSCNRNNKNGY